MTGPGFFGTGSRRIFEGRAAPGENGLLFPAIRKRVWEKGRYSGWGGRLSRGRAVFPPPTLDSKGGQGRSLAFRQLPRCPGVGLPLARARAHPLLLQLLRYARKPLPADQQTHGGDNAFRCPAKGCAACRRGRSAAGKHMGRSNSRKGRRKARGACSRWPLSRRVRSLRKNAWANV
jgi:hypothetical protein